MTQASAAIDPLDLQIANELQRDNQQKVEAIAAKVKLSPSTVHRRIAHMHKSKTIMADVAVLDPKAFGLHFTFIVEVVLEKLHAREVATIKRRLSASPNIQQIYNVTGDSDLLLVMVARDMEHFEDLSRSLFSSDPLVRRYKTSVVMDRVKSSLSIPIDEKLLPKRRKR